MCILRSKKSLEAVRVQVTFTRDQWAVIEKFKGVLGGDNAEVVRNIVLAWLSEKSMIVSEVKGRKHEETL